MKGLSNIVAAIVILTIVVSLIVSYVFVLQSMTQEYQIQKYNDESLLFDHNAIVEQINSGILIISYTVIPNSGGGYTAYLKFYLEPTISSVGPISLNITSIYGLSNGQWELISNQVYHILISTSPTGIRFSESQPSDIYVIMSYGVAVFVPINSTI